MCYTISGSAGVQMKHWEGEHCKCCTREQRLAWYTTDWLWERVVPSYDQKCVLCLECFLRMADDRNVMVKLGDIWFQGLAGRP